MIRQRHQRVGLKVILDLLSFQVVRLTRRKRRTPEGFGEVERTPGRGSIALLLLPDRLGNYRNRCRISRNEGQAFLGMEGVAVQRYGRTERLSGCAVTPRQANIGSFQIASFVLVETSIDPSDSRMIRR